MLGYIFVDMLLMAFEMANVDAMLVCPFLGLFYSWSECQTIFQKSELPGWRRPVGILGLCSVTMQAALFIALWTPVIRHRLFVVIAVPIELSLLLLTVPSLFTRKGNTRWWLLASSFLLCLDSFFVVLAELSY